MEPRQHVCVGCGYNVIGAPPDSCPFCGAPREKLRPSKEISSDFEVRSVRVTDAVTRLNSQPALGIEHAAYRVETPGGAYWIDCPSSYDRRLAPVDVIAFTHHHFLGASNQYRELFGAEVWIDERDADDPLARPFPFDRRFRDGFTEAGIEAYHVGGHTPGFTIFIAGDVLLQCDLFFARGPSLRINPFTSDMAAGREAGLRLARLTKDRDLAKVCGWGYVMDYDEWAAKLARWAANETPPPAGEGQRYICPLCGLIYDPALGLPEDGIAPGTAFEDIADDWRCTDCGVEKSSFVPLDRD